MKHVRALKPSAVGLFRPVDPPTSGRRRAVTAVSNPGRTLVPLLLVGGVLMSACSSTLASSQAVPPTAEAVLGQASQQALPPTAEAVEDQASPPALLPTARVDTAQGPLPEDLMRSDSQGAVEVEVIPIDLEGGDDQTLAFEVGMNTHSVDLSMDLAALSTLQADNGLTLQALNWSGGSGHHVKGVLRFPANAPDGRSVLDGTSRLVLIIRNVDAQERAFEWILPAAQ